MSFGRASRRRFTLLAATAVAGALTLSACSGGNKAGGGGNTNFVTGSGGISTVAKGDRVAAPKLDGEDLHGKPLDLADYQGKVVVLNVWGHWCGPCSAGGEVLRAGLRGDEGPRRPVRRHQRPGRRAGQGDQLREGLRGRVPELLRPDRQAHPPLPQGHPEPAGHPVHRGHRPGREDRGPHAPGARRGRAARNDRPDHRGEVIR